MERPAKRPKLTDFDADLFLDLASDDWSDDLDTEAPYGSPVVPVEEEEMLVHGTATPNVSSHASPTVAEDDLYWEPGDEQIILSMDPDQAFVQATAPSQPLSPSSDSLFTYVNCPSKPPLISLPPTQDPYNTFESQNPSQDAPATRSSVSFDCAFKTAAGQQLAAPSKEAVERAERLLASPALPLPPSQDSPKSQAVDSPLRGRSKTQRQLKVSSHGRPHPLSQVQSFPSNSPVPPATPQRTQTASHASQVTAAFQTPAVGRPRLAAKPFNTIATPSPVSQLFSHTPSSVFGPSQRGQTSQAPLQPPKRTIDLRMSAMKSSQTLSQRPQFVPPFKNGKRPTDQELQVLSQAIRERSSNQQLKVPASQASARHPPTTQARSEGPQQKWKSVFDLKAPSARIKWQEYGLAPGLSAYALEALEIPSEIVDLNSINAADVRFLSDGSSKGWQEAFQDLERMGSIVITDLWVKNHWSLIVWKLGGMVKAKPNELNNWWSYSNVWKQILYRYEREINRAQRSAIKRIQEQDSPAQTPMVLVVSQIYWEEPQMDESANEEQRLLRIEDGPIVSGLELTDGWYRINAQVDPVLAFAAKRGKITIGTKIQMTGARLEASREGTDVMDAQERSVLVVSANSSSIAPWDAKLGFTNKTFIATLRSLSPEGGPIALLDLVVLKIFPIGFREIGEEHRDKPAWNETEEQNRQMAWERKRQDAYEQAQRQFEATLERLADIAEKATTLLNKAALVGVPTFDVEDALEEAENAKSLAALNGLSKDQLKEVAETTEAKIQSMQSDAQTHMADEVENICPRPKISNFRVLQVRDANACDFGMEAQLTVYNAINYEAEFEVGNRYWATNIKPRTTSWSKSTVNEGEIFLLAGAGSKFIKHPA